MILKRKKMQWKYALLCNFTGVSIAFLGTILISLFLGDSLYQVSYWILPLALLYMLMTAGFYGSRGEFATQCMKHIVVVVLLNAAVLCVYIFFLICIGYQDNSAFVYSVYFLILNIIFGLFFDFIFKILLKKYQKSNHGIKSVLITSKDSVVSDIRRICKKEVWFYQITDIVVWDADLYGKTIEGRIITGNKEMLYRLIRNRVVDEIFLHVSLAEEKELFEFIQTVKKMGIVINIDFQDSLLNYYGLEKKGFWNENGILAIPSHLDIYSRKTAVIKRMIDVIGSVVGLLLTGVLLIFVAPAILLESKGPVLFCQERVGRNGRRFIMYKFRTMYQDAEERKRELLSQNEMKGPIFKIEHDPRITKVGAFLRKTSIDEFPQFYNVLKGEMSLVGTRPPMVDEFLQYELSYKKRLLIRPGITGLWQTNGRNMIYDFEDVLKYDMEYIENWSIWLDIKVILKTFGVVFTRKGSM